MKKLNEIRITVILGLFVFIAIFCTYALPSFADGVHLPEKAYSKLPEIPMQRAFISYRAGVETLIVESSLDAEGQSFGWIIPLPSEPYDFKISSSLILDGLTNKTEPEIVHDVSYGFPVFWAIIITVYLFFTIGLSFRYFRTLLLMLLALFFLSIIVGTFGKRGVETAGFTATRDNLKIKKSIEIGSYDLTVLQASQADELNTWLAANGFRSLSNKGTSIVEQYIKSKWNFVALKLKRNSGGFTVPHPLQMSFNAEKPVYPMMLTSLAGSDLHLTLFVSAGETATIDNLKLEYCDKYSVDTKFKGGFQAFKGEAYGQRFSDQAILNLLWPNAVISRYSGVLKPKDMDKDLVFEFSEYKPYRYTYYSYRGASITALRYASWFWSISFIAVLTIFRKRLGVTRGKLSGFMKAFSLLAMPIVIIWFLLYASFQKIEVIASPGMHNIYLKHQLNMLTDMVNQFKRDEGRYPVALVELLNDKYLDHEYKLTDYWWKQPIKYIPPDPGSNVFNIINYGADGVPGGTGQNQDISLWDLE